MGRTNSAEVTTRIIRRAESAAAPRPSLAHLAHTLPAGQGVPFVTMSTRATVSALTAKPDALAGSWLADFEG